MNCHEARELLAAFQDGALAPDESKAIDAHLAGCPECVAELADLVKSIQLVRDLPEVEPPPFFAKKIMAQVRAEAGVPQGLLRRLFFPLHVKIPIQALTAVFVAALSVYVYKSMGPESLRPARLEPTGEAVQAPAASAPAEEQREAAKEKGEAAAADAIPAQAERRPSAKSGESVERNVKSLDEYKAKKAEKSGKAAKADRDDSGGSLDDQKEAHKQAKGSYFRPPAASAPAKREAPADRSVAEEGPRPLGEKKAKMGMMKAPAQDGAGPELALGQGAASGGAKTEAPEKKMPENKADKAARDEESVAYAPPPTPVRSMASQDAPGRMNQEVQFAPPPRKKASAEPTERALAGATSAPETGYHEAKKPAKPSSLKFAAPSAAQAPAAAAPAAPRTLDKVAADDSAGGEAAKAPEKEASPKAKGGQPTARSVVVKVHDAAAAADALAAAVSSLNARVKEKQIRSGKEIYVVEIDAARYPALLERLKAIGAVTRSSPAPAGDEGTIEVRVEVAR